MARLEIGNAEVYGSIGRIGGSSFNVENPSLEENIAADFEASNHWAAAASKTTRQITARRPVGAESR
jgi:predicted sugar kinase